ncbi:MAG: ATP synthase F1 subunit gamma [Bdellovibrionaceae bacterium]|nr:ATP synthase F1 subunit gamma [Pseudobdellovibrionaceae bacterium]
MPNLKDIRNRIDSVKNTQKITKALKMVSAAKLRRAQQNITSLRPYAKGLLTVIADIAATHRIEHPLLAQPEGGDQKKNVLLVVLTSDRGLCGGFNSSVIKYTQKYLDNNNAETEKLDVLFIGKKGADFFKRRDLKGVKTITNLEKDISYDMAADIASDLIEHFETGDYDEIRLVYNEFKSAIQQDVTIETLLPVDVSSASLSEESSFSTDLIFEPSPEKIIDEMLEKHFAVQVYRCMSESLASEHGARMSAMENATNNASDMIRNLTLTYNKLRQASITTELIEITSGAEALNG